MNGRVCLVVFLVLVDLQVNVIFKQDAVQMLNNLRLKVSDHHNINEVQNQILSRLNNNSIMLKCLNLQQFMLADIHTISWYQILFQLTLTQPSPTKKNGGNT